jgi:glycosyltransferase involved in cell wall biosynthesis
MLTVMFSTHDGASVLPRMLESLARATPPAGGWKLVAVDNASTDRSADLLISYEDRLPLTVLREPIAGKNRALNRALAEAEGDLFVFCDDDVVVAEDWLVRWREAADALPDYDLLAGSTRPLWPYPPPQWRLDPDQISIAFGINEHMSEGPCSALCVLGTNMAVRAHVFADGLQFNADIGPDNSRNYPMGSETELARRLETHGHSCWFTKGPWVRHIVRPKQMHLQAILVRGYRWGRGQAHMRIDHHYDPVLLSRKNRLRAGLYPLLMRIVDGAEAWSRQWEWVADQGYEDGWREVRGLPPRWMKGDRGPGIAARFLREASGRPPA